MTSIAEIETDLEKISDILRVARKLAFDCHSMLLSDNVTFSIISRDKFLTRVRDSFWELAIIELSKLYGQNKRNDQCSLFVLLKYLEENRLNSEWRDKISTDEINRLLYDLNSDATKIRIDKLFDLRNQHYAHTDKTPKKNKYDIQFYFEDCFFLIELAEGIIKYLSDKILNKSIQFQKYTGENTTEFFQNHLEYIRLAGLYNLNLSKNDFTLNSKPRNSVINKQTP